MVGNVSVEHDPENGPLSKGTNASCPASTPGATPVSTSGVVPVSVPGPLGSDGQPASSTNKPRPRAREVNDGMGNLRSATSERTIRESYTGCAMEGPRS